MRMHALYSHNSTKGAEPKSGIRLNRRSALLSSVFVAAIAVAGSANATANGFNGVYDYSTWTSAASASGGATTSLVSTISPDQQTLVLQEPDNSNVSGAQEFDFSHTVASTGTVKFNYNFNWDNDACCSGLNFYVNGAAYNLANGSFANPGNSNDGDKIGSFSIAVVAGDTITFGAFSADGCCDFATSTITGFSVLPPILPGVGLASDLGVLFGPQFEGGTLKMNQVGASYSDNFTLNGSGTNTIDQFGNTSTFTGVFSDEVLGTPGGLTITNSGVGGAVIFTGVNTYTGTTTINAGATLALQGAGSIATSGDPLVNGVFDISGTASGASVVSLSGSGQVKLGAQTLTLTGATDTFSGVISDGGLSGGTGGQLVVASGTEVLTGTNTYTGGTTINAGSTLVLGNNSATGSVVGNIVDNGALSFNRSNTTTFGGVISGAGALTQAGSGLTILNGVNTMTGLTTVSAGTLEVGDATHAGAVLSSATGGVTVGALGTLKGHGSITGAVRNLAGGVVAPGGSVGTLTVGSYSQSAGSTLAIEVSPAAASQLNSLGAASLNGTLALTYDAGTYAPTIYKIVAGHPISGTFSTVSQSGLPTNFVQGVYYKPGATEVDLVVEPKSAAQAFATVSTATLDEAQAFAGMVSDRQDDAGCVAGSKKACDGVAVWGQVVGRRAHTNGQGEIASADDTSGGVIGGLDTRVGAGSIGVAVGYAENTLNMDTSATRDTGHSVFASIYGRMAGGGFVFDAQGFYMDSTWSQARIIPVYGVTNSHPNGKTGGGVVQIAYPMMDGKVKPYLKVSYADFQRDATTETTTNVGPLALDVASGSNSSTRAELGVKLSTTTTNADGMTVSPELRLGVSQDLSSNTRDVQARLALIPTTTFIASGVKPAQTSGVVAGAVRVTLTDRLDFYGDVRGRFSQNQSEGSLTVGGRYKF